VSDEPPAAPSGPAEDKIVQTIVLRTEYPDGQGGTRKVRAGKLIAQGAHASMAFLAAIYRGEAAATPEMDAWLRERFTKVCLGVGGEAELDAVYEAAKAAGLPVHLIIDSGQTEFGGVPTKTALAIGPDRKSRIDPVTGGLKLL